MDDRVFRDYFLHPSTARQRQYEALRSVFIDGLSQKDAAERFGYTYDAFRQLVCEFRQRFSDDTAPPFSTPRVRVGHPAHHVLQQFPNSLPFPTSML